MDSVKLYQMTALNCITDSIPNHFFVTYIPKMVERGFIQRSMPLADWIHMPTMHIPDVNYEVVLPRHQHQLDKYSER